MFFRLNLVRLGFLRVFMDPETIEMSILNTFKNPNIKSNKGRGEEFLLY